MAKPLLDDNLWKPIAPLLRYITPGRSKHQERKPVGGGLALSSILFVLKSGVPWEMLPAEFGCCGMTCWQRLHYWQQAGVCEQLNATSLSELRRPEQLGLSRGIVDVSSLSAVLGEKTGQNPTDRRKAGFKHHVTIDA